MRLQGIWKRTKPQVSKRKEVVEYSRYRNKDEKGKYQQNFFFKEITKTFTRPRKKEKVLKRDGRCIEDFLMS